MLVIVYRFNYNYIIISFLDTKNFKLFKNLGIRYTFQNLKNKGKWTCKQ